MIELGCVTGRFQPLHAQHLELFGIALAQCRHLVVAITNPDPGARHEESTSAHRHTASANPFTYFERARLVDTAVRAQGWSQRVTIVPFDLTHREVWTQYVPAGAQHFVRAFSEWERQKAQWFEQAGYAVTVIDGDPAAKLAASDIRSAMRSGEWRAMVPASTQALLETFLADRSVEARFA